MKLHGLLRSFTIESKVLRSNFLDDPYLRPLHMYEPPDDVRTSVPFPVIFMLHGSMTTNQTWLERSAFQVSTLEIIDAAMSRGDIPPAVLVFPDAWTSLGGSQYMNSPLVGDYESYIIDEVVPFITYSFDNLGPLAVAGKSSGGFGALWLAMKYPDVFSAVGARAPDSLFEVTMQPEFAATVKILRNEFKSSWRALFDSLDRNEEFNWRKFGTPLNVYMMASCYSPGVDVPRFPFDLLTGKLNNTFDEWLQRDPARQVEYHGEALSQMKAIFLDAGRADEHNLDLGTLHIARTLKQLDVEHVYQLDSGRHTGSPSRYVPMLSVLSNALQAAA